MKLRQVGWNRLPLLVLCALLAMVALPPLASAASPAVTISVPAIAGWVDSGIALSPGTHVTVTASGIGDCDGLTCPVDPNGIDPSTGTGYGDATPGFVAPGLPRFSLVARVGSGSPVFVGRGPTAISGIGELYLAFNDNYYPDDTGGFTATATVWAVDGPFAPVVKNGKGTGQFKAGSTIPVKFRLSEGGNPLTTATGTVSIGTATATFAWDATAQQYHANVQTDKSASGSYPVILTVQGLGSVTIATVNVR